MRKFRIAVAAYAALCVLAVAAILIHGDGPHPRILSIYPAPGDRYWPGGSAEIAFSQPMDQSSVIRALKVSPGGQGQAAWFGNVLNLQPVGDWQPGTTYQVSLVGSIADDQGRPLKTPVRFWFRVHHVGRVGYCRYRRIRNLCELEGSTRRPLTRARQSVQSYALAPDGSMLAYTAADSSGVPQLFVISVDGTGLHQLTSDPEYADNDPSWPVGTGSITYHRRPLSRVQGRSHLGSIETWNINVDGTHNGRIS